MYVKDIMTPSVSKVSVNQFLNEAAHHMWHVDCGCLPVFDDAEKIVGIITDRDICMAAYTTGQAIDAIPVGNAMSKTVYACNKEDLLEKAEETMSHYQVRRLPVLDDNDNLVGILSLNDIALAYEKHFPGIKVNSEEVATTLSRVSRHTHKSLMKMVS